VNVGGRVQLHPRRTSPLGGALPDLEIVAAWQGPGREAGHCFCPEVFRRSAQRVQAFAGMTHETLGSSGQTLEIGESTDMG